MAINGLPQDETWLFLYFLLSKKNPCIRHWNKQETFIKDFHLAQNQKHSFLLFLKGSIVEHILFLT